jgi:hypothetical protein
MKKSLLLGVLAIAILLLGAVAYASADTVTVPGSGAPNLTATDTVTVHATINPRLTLTVTTPAAGQAVNFGTVEPGTAVGSQDVTMTVSSNRPYDMTIAKVGDVAIGLGTTLGNSVANPRAQAAAYTDTYSLNVPWTTDPGVYSATVQYTVVQN